MFFLRGKKVASRNRHLPHVATLRREPPSYGISLAVYRADALGHQGLQGFGPLCLVTPVVLHQAGNLIPVILRKMLIVRHRLVHHLGIDLRLHRSCGQANLYVGLLVGHGIGADVSFFSQQFPLAHRSSDSGCELAGGCLRRWFRQNGRNRPALLAASSGAVGVSILSVSTLSVSILSIGCRGAIGTSCRVAVGSSVVVELQRDREISIRERMVNTHFFGTPFSCADLKIGTSPAELVLPGNNHLRCLELLRERIHLAPPEAGRFLELDFEVLLHKGHLLLH
mmetsp:Transcript_27086/g.59452  ORF Transcript_27086/g.59452 Transcript_27086/m.59452 type:complete len:282 (-) Transcript_27086:414-1259(-)